ncbi:sensor histidine kinase [Parafrigoribacterium soli]|uniref:sensor histidine kinase n=1 Tax=Parafrigoribacterium soli TaxID=3144663 RepID=UPI0032EDDD8F
MSGLRSVRVRILASILFVTALGMTLAGGAAFFVQRDRALAQIDSKLSETVRSLQSVADDEGGDGVPTTVRDFLTKAMQRVLPDIHESIVGIVDGRATMLPSADLSFRLDRDAAFINRVVDTADSTRVVMGTSGSRAGELRYVIIPVKIGADHSRGLYVAAYNLDAELAEIRDGLTIYTVVAALALVAVGLVGWVVAGRLLRPIRSLRETAARITETDLSERIAVVGADDVSELTVTVNDMLERLDGAFSAQRLLLDDVGHELKTPITVVRGHLELIEPDSPDDVRATRDLVLDELDRMSGLVADIALLAKTRIPDFVQPESTKLDELTEAVFSKASALSNERTWRLEETADGTAFVDPARITQALLQLAENAVKFSRPGTAIGIGSAVRDEAEFELWVRDQGKGVEKNQLAQIFQRFARADEGRGVDGAGLGLSIVGAIAEAHGGRAFAESKPGAGSRFVIRIPRRERKDQ